MRFVFAISRLATNGPSCSRIRLARAPGERGHDVTILTFLNPPEISLPGDVHVESIDRAASRYPKSALGKLWMAISLRRWFATQTVRRPIDFFSSSLTGTDRIVAKAGIRHAHYWIHIATSQLLNDAGSKRTRDRRLRIFRRLYHGRRVIGVSQGVIDDLAAIDAQLIVARRLYNAYDLDAVRAKARADDPDVPRGRFVLYAGRFAQAKRLDILIEAVRRSQVDAKLVMLTDPSSALSTLIERCEMQEQVIVLGFRDNPYPYMKAADLLILSSDREGFASVLVEALICGTPVVSTDCPSGPGEILTGEYAQWLSPTGNAEALAANIRRALSVDKYDIAPWLYQRFTLEAALDELESIARGSPRPALGRFLLPGAAC